jgi:hypothetical protein
MKSFFSAFAQQIASAVVDAPYSGFLVNQSIEESFEILQWETERTTAPVGTYALSMPSGLASNKQSILFFSADSDVTLAIVTRDYANTQDFTFTVQVVANEPFYAVLQNIKSASFTCAATARVQSFVAKVSPTAVSATTSPNQGIDPGSLPVGGIIPISGTFASTGPLAGYSEAGINPLPSYLQLCDGSLVTDSESIFFGKFLPDLTGNKTLLGSVTAGTDQTLSTSATVLTGFGVDWNIFQSVDVAAGYTCKFYMRIK